MMTETEKKALALVNEVTFGDEPWTLDDVRGGFVFKALCRAIEQHEAFKQEVSDAVKGYASMVGLDPKRYFARFILPKPDPLVEAINSAPYLASAKETADHIRAALAARGLEIREKQP